MAAAVALYGGGSEQDRQGLSALGFSAEMMDKALAEDVTEVWPENWDAVVLFDNLQGEWNIGGRGAIGLRRDGVLATLRMSGVARGEWPRLLEQIRILERAALEEMNRGG